MKNRISVINQKVLKALKQIEREENVVFSLDVAGFSDTYYKVPLVVTSNSKEDKKAIRQENTRNCKLLGFTKNVVGKSFTSNGQTFTVTGLKLNRPKFPVSAVNRQGKSYKFPVNVVERGLI